MSYSLNQLKKIFTKTITMKSLRNTIFALIFSALSFTSMDAQFQFGAGASVILESPTTFGVQGRALYGLNEQFDIAGSFTYWLRTGIDFSFDVNAHYNLLTFGEGIALAPIAGINYLSTGFGSNIGINVGAHFKVPTGGMTIYLEPKLIFDNGSILVLSGGVLFGGGE